MIQIDDARLSRFLDSNVHLVRGIGEGINGTFNACAMQAADWLAGGDGQTDAPECVDLVIRRFCIGLNDAGRFEPWRDELKPYIARTVGTKTTGEATAQRAFMCADWAVRNIAPKAFDVVAEILPKTREFGLEWAKKLRDVAPIVDEESARAGYEVAREARSAAYAASAADAASAAYAASAADAASAAYAAYAASKAAAFSRTMWDESLKLLDRLIAVTESGVANG